MMNKGITFSRTREIRGDEVPQTKYMLAPSPAAIQETGPFVAVFRVPYFVN